MKLKRTAHRMVVDESDPLFNATDGTWIGVTTLRDYKDLAPITVASYETIVSSQTPKKFLPILNAAKKKKSNIDQINIVTSELADRIRYIGDWRKVDGTVRPRALQLVADTGFGDCKDFTASTVNLLRKLGFKAYPAWVIRGINHVTPPLKIASTIINHAIVYAQKDGQIYWVDPTNLTSYAQEVFPDIFNRDAIVLFPDGPKKARIPALSAEKSGLHIEYFVKFDKSLQHSVTGQIQLDGVYALSMTGTQRSFSKKILDNTFVKWIATPGNLTKWKFGTYDLTSRIVGTIRVPFEFTESRWSSIPTTAGTGYFIGSPPDASSFRIPLKDRQAGLTLVAPGKWRRSYRFEGVKFLTKKDLDCAGDSAWLQFSRRIDEQEKYLYVRDELVVKQSPIAVDDIKSKEFAAFQDKLFTCMRDTILIAQ